jgi:hypothetical protein
MAAQIEAILGLEEARNLRDDFNELIMSDDCNYGEVEDLLMGYGLEMDYLDQLMW